MFKLASTMVICVFVLYLVALLIMRIGLVEEVFS